MKTMQAKTDYVALQQRYRFLMSCFAMILGLGVLLYYGYCWGLWGRNSLLLQYLFQCNCPPASEEWRYPRRVDVLVPACKNQGSLLSPSGRLLYVRETEAGVDSSYLLNLETNAKIPFTPSDGGFLFLTDDLLFVIVLNGKDEYILDRTTGVQYPIQRFSALRSKGYSSSLAEALHDAKYIFLLNDYGGTVVTLSSDFPASSEYNFYFNDSYIPGDASDRMENFLNESGITYKNIPFRFQHELISPNGELVAQIDGVYSIETNQQIVKGISSWESVWMVRGWMYDNSAVIYSHHFEPCVIESNFGFFDGNVCFLKVPQPVIKLKVPEEYLTPTQTP